MSEVVYRFGLLLTIFGGFLALNSTGLFADIGIGALFLGPLIGTLGLLGTSLSRS